MVGPCLLTRADFGSPFQSSTVAQGLSRHHFVPVFADCQFALTIFVSFLESLSDLHIDTVSLQRGCREDVALCIDDYRDTKQIRLEVNLTV